MDHISLIIVHYNTLQETRECLKSLAQIQVKNFEYQIIVIDNGSKEPLTLSAELARRVVLVRSESNLGFTGGNNLGIKYALDNFHSDYILLLNNDTFVAPDFLEALYAQAQKNPEQGLICPKIYFAKNFEFHKSSYAVSERGNVLWYAGGSIDWPNLVAFHRGVDEIDRGQFDNQKSSEFATGCCILIRREVLEKIGVFDEEFFLYLEDVDLSVRAQKNGFEIGFCPTSRVWHKNAGSSGGSGSDLHQYYQTRNRLLFGLKHGSRRVQLTTLRYIGRLLLYGNHAERLASSDLIQGKLGKRIVV